MFYRYLSGNTNSSFNGILLEQELTRFTGLELLYQLDSILFLFKAMYRVLVATKIYTSNQTTITGIKSRINSADFCPVCSLSIYLFQRLSNLIFERGLVISTINFADFSLCEFQKWKCHWYSSRELF